MRIRYSFWLLVFIAAITTAAFSHQHYVIQAEDATTIQGKIATNHNNYTGTGFVDGTNAVGAYIEWKFSIKDAGNDSLFIFYAHGKTGDRSMSITLNDSMIVPSMSFNPTANYDTWVANITMIPLKKGGNILRLTALTADGGPNLDRIEIAAEPGAMQYELVSKVIGRGSITRNPNSVFYDAGTVVTLTAVPQTGSNFDSWTGDKTGSTNPDTIIMNSNRSVTANFISFIHASVYLSPDGNDSTGTGTIDQPYYSLSKAADAVQPGDTIYMRGGTYKYKATVFLAKTGSEAAPFVVTAYQNEKPLLSWADWVPANETERSNGRGIKITNTAKYWYLKKLDIGYAPDNGVKCEGAHTTFDQCVFHHNGDGGLQIGLGKDSLSSNPDPENFAAYNRVINCDSYRNADPGTDYENADGFSCKLYAGKDNYFYGCRAWENCDDGWDCYQTEYQITIERCWSWHNGDPADWGFTSFNGDGNAFKLGGNDTPCPITIKNCVGFDSPFGAMCCFNDNNNGAPVTVLNCTAWGGGKDFKLQTMAHILKNNLAFDPKSGKNFTRDLSETAISVNNSWDLPTLTADYNDFESTSAADAIAPREADGSLPNNGFAKLKAGSDMIDKGVYVGLPFYGSAPDLGAYEYGLTVDVKKQLPKISTFSLEQNYPNPFNPVTVIGFHLVDGSRVSMKVFDAMGREVTTLVDEYKPAGEYTVRFNGAGLTSGVYYYELRAGTFVKVNKMLLLK